MTANLPQVGAPDPELNASPIFDQDDEISLDLETRSWRLLLHNHPEMTRRY